MPAEKVIVKPKAEDLEEFIKTASHSAILNKLKTVNLGKHTLELYYVV